MKRLVQLASCTALSLAMVATTASAGSNPKGKPFVAINDQIVEVQGAVNNLQGQIDSLVARVDSVEERVTADEQAITNLNGQNAALQALVNNSLTSAEDIQAEIALLQTDNNNLNVQLSALSTGDSTQIDALQAQVDSNMSLITTLQDSILLVQNGTISLESSLQGQINNNLTLINSLQDEVSLINSALEEKQNLINGVCPDGSAVKQVLADGSVICGEAGGGGPGTIETIYSYIGQNADPGGQVHISATCPGGYTVVSAGMTNATGWDIFRLHTTSSTTGGSALLIATNDNSYSTWITAVATCMRIVQ